MNAGLTRRSFIRGRRSGEQATIRPPWSTTDSRFLARCTRCGDCADACAENIIVLDRQGLPEVNFKRGACTCCGQCAAACTPGALRRPVPGERAVPWALAIRFSADCLDRRGITCRVCAEGCEEEAIDFHPVSGNRWIPNVDDARCSGCGACHWGCPVGAVTIQTRHVAAPLVA